MIRVYRQRGVTILEMLVVVTLIGVMVGISFPAVTSGVDSLRLLSAADSVASFLNGALNRAERRQEVMEVSISKSDNKLVLRSSEPNFVRELPMPSGITITAVLPEIASTDDGPRRIFLYPGGTVPRIGIELTNRRNARKIVRVDPMTGAPQIDTVTEDLQ